MLRSFILVALFIAFSFSAFAQPEITKSAAKDSLVFLKNQVVHLADELIKEEMRAHYSFRRFEEFQNGKFLSQDSMMWALGEIRVLRDAAKPKAMQNPQILDLEQKIKEVRHIVQWEYAENEVAKEAYETTHFPKLASQTQTLFLYWDIYREDLNQMAAQEGKTRGSTGNHAYLLGSNPEANAGMGNGIGYKLYRDCATYVDSLVDWAPPTAREKLADYHLSPAIEGKSWVQHTFSGNVGQNLKALDELRSHLSILKDTYIRETFGGVFE